MSVHTPAIDGGESGHTSAIGPPPGQPNGDTSIIIVVPHSLPSNTSEESLSTANLSARYQPPTPVESGPPTQPSNYDVDADVGRGKAMFHPEEDSEDSSVPVSATDSPQMEQAKDLLENAQPETESPEQAETPRMKRFSAHDDTELS